MRLTVPPRREDRKPVHQRYEAKYLLTAVTREMLRDYVLDYTRPDTHTARYWVTSVYYDSADWHTFRSSLHGEKNRFKLRVRAYGEPGGAGCFAEVKQRIDGIIRKHRAALDLRLADAAGFTAADWSSRLQHNGGNGNPAAFESFARHARQLDAAPRLGVRYQRDAFESVMDEPVRITIDSDLGYLPPGEMRDGPASRAWRALDTIPAVLEVKFTDAFPFWVRRLIDRFELTRISLAKYVACVQSFAADGGLRESSAEDMPTWTT